MDSVETFDSATVLASSKSSAADRAVRDALESRYVRNYWFFLSAIIASLTVFRVARYTLSRLWTSRRARDTSSEKGDAERNAPRGTGRISFRRLPDAFASGFRNLVFRCSIPIGPSSTMSVAELAFVVVYLAITLVFLFIQTRTLNPSFWQDRAAHLASCQVPLIVALAGKNNIISALTGVSHERLNVLHRAAARTCFVLSWIHAVSRASRGLPEQFNFTHNWMIAGAVALTAFSLATLLSIQPIRNAVFEVFLVSHIVLVMIFIICGYFHAGEQGFGAYFWPGLVVWASDRVLRLLRIVWNNWSRTDSTSSTANVQLLAEDTIRLTVRMRTKWTPGQHAYIIMPTISKLPTEAHPFTIASIPMTTQGSNDNEAIFLIRGRGGFTRRLKKHAMEASSEPVPVYVDGPYGCPPNLHEYSTCILIAGGSGISYTLGLFLDLIHNHTSVKSSVQRVVFVWAVRDGAHLSWITEEVTKALSVAPAGLAVEPRIYITGPNYPIPQVPALESDDKTSSSTSSLPSDLKSQDLPQYSALKLANGRPSIKKLLHQEINSALGPVSVDVAGPSALSESVRKVLRQNPSSPLAVLRGASPVTLHVETFGMVKQ